MMATETLRMPRLGETMEEGRLVAWLKQPGEAFARGDVLAEVETDKTVVELPALTDGRMVRALAAAGEDVAVDAPIAEIEVASDDAPARLAGAALSGTAADRPLSAGSAPSPARDAAAAPKRADDAADAGRSTGEHVPPVRAGEDRGERVRATPLARRLARRHGVAIDSLAGTGRRGRVEAADVLRHAGVALDVAAPGPRETLLGASRPDPEALLRPETVAWAEANGGLPAVTGGGAAVRFGQPSADLRPPSVPAGAGEPLHAVPIFGGRMSVAIHGAPEDPPVLLLHGFAGFNGSWGGFPALLARRGRRVVVPDLPAHGATTLPAATPEDLAAPLPDLLAALAIAPGKAEIVGHSLGGVVATRLAETLLARGTPPQRLTLLGPAGMGREIDRGFIRAMAAGPTAGALAHLLRKVAVRDPALSAEVLEARSATLQGGRIAAIAALLAHPSGQGTDIVAALRRLAGRIPTRIGFGVKDEIIPWTHVARAPAAVAVHLFENAGHMIHWDAPEELLELLALPRDEPRGNG